MHEYSSCPLALCLSPNEKEILERRIERSRRVEWQLDCRTNLRQGDSRMDGRRDDKTFGGALLKVEHPWKPPFSCPLCSEDSALYISFSNSKYPSVCSHNEKYIHSVPYCQKKVFGQQSSNGEMDGMTFNIFK